METLKEGNVYYYIIDNYGKSKLEKQSATFSMADNETILETMDIPEEEQEGEVDCFLIFLINGVNFRGNF